MIIKDITDDEAIRVAEAFTTLFNLPSTKDGNYLTSWGAKNKLGLGRSIISRYDGVIAFIDLERRTNARIALENLTATRNDGKDSIEN